MSNWWRTSVVCMRKNTMSNPSRSYHMIQALPRDITGNRVSVKHIAQGRIPAVVFSKPNPNTDNVADDGGPARSVSRKHLLTTERKQIQTVLKSIELPYFCSTTFPLQIRVGPGSSTLLESGNVLPIKVHRDSKTGKLLNLVFVWADEGTGLKVDMVVVFKGGDV